MAMKYHGESYQYENNNVMAQISAAARKYRQSKAWRK
jgi:hypothetical protein